MARKPNQTDAAELTNPAGAPPAEAGVDFVDFSALPAEFPAADREKVDVVVVAKPARGRWRAGMEFSREPRVIPLAKLADDQLDALRGDAELVVTFRVYRPKGD